MRSTAILAVLSTIGLAQANKVYYPVNVEEAGPAVQAVAVKAAGVHVLAAEPSTTTTSVLTSSTLTTSVIASSTTTNLPCSTPMPWPFRCGVTGSLASPAPQVETQSVASLDDCRDICMYNNTCQVFGYNADTLECFTTEATLRQEGFKARAGVISYWNRHCFNCEFPAAPTPTPTPKNLVKNSDFSTGDLSRWTVSGITPRPKLALNTTSGVTTPGNGDAYSFFVNEPTDGKIVFLSQVLATIVNNTYSVTFDYMVANKGVQEALYVLAGVDDQTGAYEFYAPPNGYTPGVWQILAGSFTAQDNGTFGFIFSSSGNQTFYIDNVNVRSMSS